MVDITNIAQLKENSQLEVKKAAGGLPMSLWETYSAFANTNGGVILLGISEENNALKVTGVQDASQKIQDIWNTLNNPQKVSANVLTEKRIYEQKVDGKDIIAIEVPRADRHDKPVYINNDLLGGTFRRNAEGDYRCSQQTVKSMLRDQSDLPIDSAVIYELSWSDLDRESIARYRNRFASLKPAHIWNGLDTVEFLKKIGSVRKNEEGTFSPTLAGLVMFGTEDVITQILPDYFLDYREKYGHERWSDRIVSNLGEWSGNIFDFFFRIADKITADIKRPFRMINNLEREDDTAIHKAIREALANAVIHADYYGKRGIVVEKSRHKIRIANPGTCRPAISEILEGDVSDPRNPTIFKMFALIDIGERAGSGIFNLVTLWKQANWNAPVLEESFDTERTTLTVPIELTDEVEHDANKSNENSNEIAPAEKTVEEKTVEETARKISVEKTVEKSAATVEKTVEKPTATVEKTVEKPTATVEKPAVTVEKTVEKPTATVEKPAVTVEKTVEKPTATVEKTVEKPVATVEKPAATVEKTVEKPAATVEKTAVTVEKTVEKILELLQNNPYTTQEELVKSTGLTRRGVEWNISQLKANGLLERIGPDKGGYWKTKHNLT
ncbi:MAG: putative DNA binding domain-containing protein [Prevotellaceae bacterium]|jgi:predicted HTH transcriptional regulator|nr:putative DNA binding domain-containing protein [Prevotellaceae bacterium]